MMATPSVTTSATGFFRMRFTSRRKMASNEIAGAKEKGVYSFMKHFALNDQECLM